MGQDWTKKRVAQLLLGNDEAIDQWLDDFVGPIYTWLYYHVAADEDLAAELTGKTLEAALRDLSTFNPVADSMYHWLKDKAKQIRNDVLMHRQMKPQRPWAWAQLPKQVLNELSKFRSEAISDEIVSNINVQQLTQAAIVEMGQADRDLMQRRYSHLDTPSHIAADSDESIEQINDQLYRCRHFFRRILIQLIQAENPGFMEAADAGEVEQLDNNLEKLLSATAMYKRISNPHYRVICDIAAKAAHEAALMHKQTLKRPNVGLWVTVAAAIITLLLIGVVVIMNLSKEPPPVPPDNLGGNTQAPSSPEPPEPTIEDQDIDEEELRKVLMMGDNGDLIGLLQILRNGKFASQLFAAHYVGQLGSEAAIGLLQEAELKWYPEGPDDNAFALAIIKIEERLAAEDENIYQEPNMTTEGSPEIPATEPGANEPVADANEPAHMETTVEPPRQQPVIGGIVTDYNNDPVPGATVMLSYNPLRNASATQELIDSIRTDSQGRYAFSRELPQTVFVDFTIPSEHTLRVQRALLCQPDTPYHIDFIGSNVISGTLDLGNQDPGKQILYLSDAMDPAEAAFRCETETNDFGQFMFSGVLPRDYYLLWNTIDNRIIPLTTIEVLDSNIENWQVSADYATLNVMYEQSDQSPQITHAILTYGLDVSQEFQQYELFVEPETGIFWGNAPQGTYTLLTTFDNGMQLTKDIELNGDRIITVPVPDGTASLSGKITSPGSTLLIYNPEMGIRFNLEADDDGFYDLDMAPAGRYELTVMVKGLPITLMEVDLEDELPQALDIDPDQWSRMFAPLYVIVVNESGNLVNGARVWLTGDGEVVTTQSSGRGCYLAAPAGEYALQAAYPGKPAVEELVTLTPAPLLTDPNPDNTVILTIP